VPAADASRLGGWSATGLETASSCPSVQPGLLVEVLQQTMNGALDVLVPPLGGTLDAGDQTGTVQSSKISVHKGIPRFRLVRCTLGQSEMPPCVLVPGVRLEVGVLRVGARLHLTPVTIEDVLPSVDEFAGSDYRGLRTLEHKPSQS
jgi:hypothetical protein